MESYPARMAACKKLREEVVCTDQKIFERQELIFLFLNRTNRSANDAKRAAQYAAENMVCQDHNNN